MLFIRSCRPDRISFCITTYIVRNLGQNFVEPPVLDLKAVLDDSVAWTPLIFVLSPGVDPTGVLMQLAENRGMATNFLTLSLGQGQAPIATRLLIKSSHNYTACILKIFLDLQRNKKNLKRSYFTFFFG